MGSRAWWIVAAVLTAAVAARGEVAFSMQMGRNQMVANQTQTGYVRVALTGQSPEGPRQRALANVALVIDRSGSMTGEKLAKAKEAAVMVLENLSPDDIFSVVAYDNTINVVVPATKVKGWKQFLGVIQGIRAGGNTALYDGVSVGLEEVRKFKDEQRVNRIVLLSDGLANVGPSSADELAQFGERLRAEDVSVTTIGIGLDYNEDLMTSLASKSDGNHMFAETASDVLKAFSDELVDMTSVVAKNLSVQVDLDPHVKPVRGMGREVNIQGQSVFGGLAQLYAGQTKYVLLEVEVSGMSPDQILDVGRARLTYGDPLTGNVVNRQTGAAVLFTPSPAASEASENKDVMECVVAQLSAERNEEALRLRDRGDIAQSRQTLQGNAQWLQQNAAKYNSEALEKLRKSNADQAQQVADPSRWKALRKSMSKGQYDIKQQTAK